jgi:putative transposase
MSMVLGLGLTHHLSDIGENRFPPEIIGHGVWLYHRFSLSFRDVEELLAKRGIIVTYETVRQWCRKFGPEYARRLKRRQGRWTKTGT